MVFLRNDHILAFCAVRKRAHISELFQRDTYAFLRFSHFLHFVAHAWPTVPKARAFHIIWETRKSCLEADIRTTFTQFSSLNSQAYSYTVKKSFCRLDARKAWWFTVIASSPTARTSLDEVQEANKPDANWTLLKSLRDRSFLPHGQSHPHQTPLPAVPNALPSGSLPSLQTYPPS